MVDKLSQKSHAGRKPLAHRGSVLIWILGLGMGVLAPFLIARYIHAKPPTLDAIAIVENSHLSWSSKNQLILKDVGFVEDIHVRNSSICDSTCTSIWVNEATRARIYCEQQPQGRIRLYLPSANGTTYPFLFSCRVFEVSK